MDESMEIEWHGTSRRDLMRFPRDAKSDAGHALRQVQMGLEPADWKPMSSIGSRVREIRITDPAGAFRVIYVAHVKGKLHVLHAFQKKTQKTAQHDIALAKARFKEI